MKLYAYLFILSILSFSSLNADIYEINCKHFKEFGGNAKIKTSTWYVHNVKKKVILAKINNSKVKFISNQWVDNKGYGASTKKTPIDSIQIKKMILILNLAQVPIKKIIVLRLVC